MASEKRRLLVLGLGNVLCGDDGLGVAAVEILARRYETPSRARVLDGGTLGLALLSQFEGVQDVILVDAITADHTPGSFVRLEGDDVAPAVRNRLSVHQVGVADLLDSLRLLESFPERLTLLGLVPESLQLSVERSEAVEKAMSLLVQRIVEEAERLGYDFVAKTEDETPVGGFAGFADRTLGVS